MAKVREGSDAQMKAYQESRKAREASAAEYNARSVNAKPTPTAEECDLIKMGLLDLDGKEDDGSGPERVRVTEMREVDRSMQAGSGSPYETRAQPQPQPASEQPRRR